MQARYLRVQLEEPAHLTLGEVQVFTESARVVSSHDEGLPNLQAAHRSLHQDEDRLHYISAQSLSAVFVGQPMQVSWTLRVKDKRTATRADIEVERRRRMRLAWALLRMDDNLAKNDSG